MPNDGPVPTYPSSRLIGIELEFDAGGATLHLPDRMPAGWHAQPDGSCPNGMEVILNPPRTLTDATPLIKNLSEKLDELGTYVSKRGGFHLHVQIADYSIEDAAALANIYTHFQPVIDRMVGKSRVGNTYCPPYDGRITPDQIAEMFQLRSLVDSRSSARSARRYKTCQFAMMRTRDPMQRTVEFRQGSPSKRVDNVVGWSAMLVAFTDLAKHFPGEVLRLPPTLEGLKRAMAMAETHFSGQHLSAWVQWRYDYLNEEPSEQMLQDAVMAMGNKIHGMFFIARKLNVNNALAQRILDRAAQQGMLTKVGAKYRAQFSTWAERDLVTVANAMAERETAASTSEPAPA